MRLADDALTLFIPYYDDGELQYQKQVIYGVSWHQSNKAAITTEGLKSADVVNVRIPEEAFPAEYVRYASFLPDDGTFALHEGMPVCRGDVEASGLIPASLIDDYGRECVKTLVSFTENLRGREPHLRLVLT